MDIIANANNNSISKEVFDNINRLKNVYIDKQSEEFKNLFKADTLEELVSKPFPKDFLLQYGISYIYSINSNIIRENSTCFHRLRSVIYKLPNSKQRSCRRILI